MAKKYLITSALPYVNNNLHIGHLVGCWLPSDVYARFCRACGRDVLYVCGADEHGTTSEIGAQKENMPIEEYVDKYRAAHEQSVRDFNLSFDIYGRTHTQKHHDLIQSLFLRLVQENMIVEKSSLQPYSVNEQMFLADRFVIGTCPRCGFDGAYGNECGKCGATLEPEQLINPHSAVDASSPVEMRETKHLYFRTSAMQDKLRTWIDSRQGWSKTALAIANKWLAEGLQDSPITRDIKWGIPVNKPGYENKVFYVWFDAPWGYVSISQAINERWADWWHGGDDVHYTQFMGKDNVSFHSIFFPAQELAMNDNWKTVDVLKCMNFLNMNGAKISKSTGNGVFLNDTVKELPADYWRYALIASAPETDDTDFTIARFADIVNKDLNGMLGNFVSRVCKLTAKNFGNVVPKSGAKNPDLENQLNEKLAELTAALDACEFRKSISALRGLYAIGNEYMTKCEPWALVKNGDLDGAGQCLNECMQMIDLFTRVSAPFIPGTAEKMQAIFANKYDLSWPNKYERRITDGAEFVVPENLFNRIDDEMVARLTEKYTPQPVDNTQKPIVAEIVDVKNHPTRDDLHVLSVNTGTENIQIVCGAPNVYVGLRGVLAPVGCKLPGVKKPMTQRTVAGVESFGMMCSASEIGCGNDDKNIIELSNETEIGSEYKC